MKQTKRILSLFLALMLVIGLIPAHAHAAEADATLAASLSKAKSYIDGITINNASNDPATVVKNFNTHFTWDNEKRENSKSYLFDWSYYNGVVFEGIEFVYEVTGEPVYKDYVVEYMSNLIASNGTWAKCSNNSGKECAGYNATHGADCYMTAALLLDSYQMTGDQRYLTMAKTLYADLDSAATKYSLKNAGNNYRHTWASDPSPDLWLDGLYMILPFRAEYAKYIGDQEELDLIVSRMQWVSDNMYNSSKKLFYHAADNASSNSGTYWLRSIGWYAAAIVDIMDSMQGSNLEIMKAQLKKLVDGMKACQNTSNGMWLNNMNAAQSSNNPYETSGTALTCYAVMKAVNNGWLDESYADMAILAFNGICNEKLSGSTLKDICFKGAPGSSNSTFYNNEGKGVGPFIMFYAEMLEYVNKAEEEPEPTEPEATEPEVTEPEVTEPKPTEPEPTEPEPTEPEEEDIIYQGTGNLEADVVYTLDSDGINSGEKYLIVYSNRALQNNNGVDNNPSVTVRNNQITLTDDSNLAWTITQSNSSNYYVENNGSYLNLSSSGNDPIGSSATVYITGSSTYKFRNTSSSGAYLRYSNSQLFCAGTNNSNNGMYLYRRTGSGTGSDVVFTLTPASTLVKPGSDFALNGTVSVGGQSVALSSCSITWNSSDNAVATVSNGTVTGVASGNATITATLSAVNGTNLKNNIVLTIPVTVQGHDYKSVVTAPTCTEKGYTTYTCAICGDSYTTDEVAALGHSYKSVTTEATCTAAGSNVYTCHCGDTYTEVIPATGHNYNSVVTAPTCTAEGYTTYTCACGDSYVANKVAALGHNYKSKTTAATCTKDGSIVYTCHCGDTYTEVLTATGHDYKPVVTAPTCTEEGYTTYTCACGDSYVADEVDALGHNYKSVTTAATCTKDGAIVYTCHCGDTYAEVLPATGHDYKSVVTAPTCTEVGYTTYTCACEHSYIAEEVAALGHEYKSVITAPTCTEDGYTAHTCQRCGEVTVDSVVAALGHDYKSVTTAATCTKDGSIIYTCHCGDTYTEVIPAAGHNYMTVVTEPTCTKIGFTTYTCDCGDTYVADEIAALGHDYETVTTAATCTKDGFVVYTCHCGDTYTEVLPATGHNYSSVLTAPTCTESGYTTYTCACGETYIADEVAALGHTYESVTVDATCTENGSITYTCNCGDSYVDVINAKGHTYEATVTEPTCSEGGYTTYSCGICNDSYVTDEIAALGHSYGSLITAPTCTESGYTTYTCDCGHSYVSDEVAALGHSYESVITTPTCIESGYTTHTCHCGDSFVDSVIEPTSHSYTCVEENGFLVYTCDYCGDTYSEVGGWIALSYARLSGEGVQTYGHEDIVTTDTILNKLSIQLSNDGVNISGTVAVTPEMVTWNQSFDGTTAGTYTASISYNGVNLGGITVTITGGHTYTHTTTEATCTTGGKTINTCTDCGYSYENNYTTALGHSYHCVETNGYFVYTCNNCGDSYSEKSTSYTQVNAIGAGNDYVITLYANNNYYALSHTNNSISVVPVNVSDGEIISEITQDMLWTYSGGKMGYISNGTTYYMYTSSNNWWGNWWGSSESTLSLSTSNSSTVSFSSNKLKVGSNYLKYSNGSVTLNSSATTTYIFVEG